MLVLFFFVVAVVITAVLASLWHVEIQVRSLEKNSQSAFYLAQAGIEEAKAWARTNSGTTSSTNVSMGSGRYRYIVSLGTGERIIDATGEVLDASNAVIAVRRIQLRVTGTPPPSTNVAVVLGSWREM
ncbi:MAG: hypothetical protein AABZ65_02315 [Candidatus Omnitrophota bacterium]